MQGRMLRTTTAGVALLFALITLTIPSQASETPDAIATRAFEMRMAGQVAEAVVLLEGGLQEYPRAAILHHELARARLYLLEIDAMVASAEAAVECEPGNNDFRYFAALAAGYALIDAAHHHDEAKMKAMGQDMIAHLQTIVESDPGDHRARCMLVEQSVETAPRLGIDVGDPEEHVRIIEGQDPILGARARCCLVGEKQQRKIWKQVLADHPGEYRALVEAADGLTVAGDLDRASECLHQAMEMDEEGCYGLLRLGLAHAMKEDWNRARELTEEYLATEPPIALKAFATARMAMIYRRMGAHDRADQLTRAAREMDPHVWETVMPPPREIFTPL